MFHAYVRVSTAEQANFNAASLSEQLRKCRALAQLRGVDKFDVAEYRDEGVSGAISLSKRPEGGRMWAALQPKDVVVAATLDRLFRSSTDALNTMERLKERKVDVIILTMGMDPVGRSAISQLFFEMLAAFAGFERGLINERTRDGKTAKRIKTGFLGGAPPYGWKVDGKKRTAMLIADPVEQEVVQLVLRRFQQKRVQTEILVELKEKGYTGRDGKPFTYYQIKRIYDYSERCKDFQELVA